MTLTPRIVILGANGQVAAEVVCRLVMAGADVVAICRSHRASAYLRHRGIAVRHGSVDKLEDVSRLLGDADLVANFALALGKPAQMRKGNDAIIMNALVHSPPNARHIFFSTLAVHPDFNPEGEPRVSSPYGREKLRNEALCTRLAKRLGKPLLILRLGHVTGALQGISSEIAGSIRVGPVPLPDGERLANVTDTSTIARAIWSAAVRSEGAVGRYDLTELPPRAWNQVLQDEAARWGLDLATTPSSAAASQASTGLRQYVKSFVSIVLRSPTVKRFGPRLLEAQSAATNDRARAAYAVSAASASVAQMKNAPKVMSAMRTPAYPVVPFPMEAALPEELGTPGSALPASTGTPFPDDQPDARPDPVETRSKVSAMLHAGATAAVTDPPK